MVVVSLSPSLYEERHVQEIAPKVATIRAPSLRFLTPVYQKRAVDTLLPTPLPGYGFAMGVGTCGDRICKIGSK